MKYIIYKIPNSDAFQDFFRMENSRQEPSTHHFCCSECCAAAYEFLQSTDFFDFPTAGVFADFCEQSEKSYVWLVSKWRLVPFEATWAFCFSLLLVVLERIFLNNWDQKFFCLFFANISKHLSRFKIFTSWYASL